ncbi:hypothetical protein [Salegentibacter sp. UBA1130]|uniref:hypothetical protein n=1 Tax=Salegentibacter sp. UBA1130 TaxID=1947451 RepID=UPI0025794FA3|nr:hypothetical protein [Salegentibacter sp. UBA1130]
MNGEKLHENLHTFLRHIESIKDTLPMVLLLINPYQKKANEKLIKFLENNVEEIDDEDGEKVIAVKYEETRIFESLSKNYETSSLASKIIPESLFVSLISQYDAFLNRLLKALYDIRPEYLNNSERNISFSQLVEFKSIGEAREYIIEKEIETVLRKSHSDHFEYLESKLAIPLRKDLPVWSTFIEITERRNLLVHNDGKVSNQYFKVCKENKCVLEDMKLNDRLRVTPEYFKKAYSCLFEISVKLTHTLWRKLLKDDLEEADKKLNDICYDLLSSKQFNIADILLDYACKQKKHHNEALSNIFTVNKSLSKYLHNNKEKTNSIISQKDWSASSDNFKLAHLVLTENYKDSYKLMKKIGNDGEVDKENYMTWPLFSDLRKEKGFKDTFKEIFGEEYTVLEIPKKPLQEVIEEQVEKNPDLKHKTTKKAKKEINK